MVIERWNRQVYNLVEVMLVSEAGDVRLRTEVLSVNDDYLVMRQSINRGVI